MKKVPDTLFYSRAIVVDTCSFCETHIALISGVIFTVLVIFNELFEKLIKNEFDLLSKWGIVKLKTDRYRNYLNT